MTIESILSKRLQRFSIVDLGLVKTAYLILGLFVFSIYPVLDLIDWWFYLILAILCVLPLGIHLFSQAGNLWQKTRHYIKTNNPANHVLLALTMFFYAILFGKFFPFLINAQPWVYLVLALALGIKPLKTFWLQN